MSALQAAQKIDWESPLKRSKPNAFPKTPSTARSKLVFEEKVEPRTLSQLYNFELDKPPFIDKDRRFFKVRDLVIDIEAVLKKHPDNETTSRWRARVSEQLLGADFEKKMAELGAILFYIAKDEENFELLVDLPSMMEYRAQELQQEIESYLEKSQTAGLQPAIPSGKIHYLMRAFAHMVITKDHVYNRGGLIAIQELLLNPQYPIAQYLQPEHRDHIITVTKELLSKPSTEKVFSEPVTIHDSLKDLIRIDLKLESNSPIDSTLVLYDCLMALFADVRQFDYPNCYAISSFIYATENHTSKTLFQTLNWLKTGYYSFDKTINIPIRPLLEGRLTSCKDFSVWVDSDSVFTLAPFEHIQSTLSLTACTKTETTQQPSQQLLGTALRSLLRYNDKNEQWSYVRKLYDGFKYNALVTMHIAILEFENSNLSNKNEVKEQLICSCITAIEKATKKKLDKDVIQKLGCTLESKIWLQPCYEKKVCLKDGTIKVGDVEVIPFVGTTTQPIFKLLHKSVRAFILKNDVFKPLYSITDLRSVVTSTMRELGITGTLDANRFAKEISEVCRDNIRGHFAVSAEMLKMHDLLVFAQDGGNGDVVLDHVYNISASKEKITASSTPYEFLEKLFLLSTTFTRNTIAPPAKLLISSQNNSPQNHQWTVNAKCWKIFSTCTRFYSFIQQNTFEPAKKRLNSPISQDVFISIVLRYTTYQNKIDALMDAYRNLNQPTYRAVLDLLYVNTPIADYDTIRSIVDDEFLKISMTKLALSRVLHYLNISVETATFERIYNTFNESKTFPFLLARDLRLALIESQIAVLDPQDIETALCKVSNLPLAINVGDLNWTDDDTEDPFHTTLWARYSYWDNTLGYFIRKNNSETRDLNKHYRNIVIHHPKQVTRR